LIAGNSRLFPENLAVGFGSSWVCRSRIAVTKLAGFVAKMVASARV
jgi:hypothetical protein